MVSRAIPHGSDVLLVAGSGLVSSGEADHVVATVEAMPGVASVHRAGSPIQSTELLSGRTFATVLVDLALPGVASRPVLDVLRHAADSTGLVLLAGAPGGPGAPGRDVDRMVVELCADDVVLREELGSRHLVRAVAAASRRARTSREHALLRDRSAALAAGSTDGLVVLSDGGSVETVNDVAARYLGVVGRRLRGLRLSRAPWTFVDREDREVPARDCDALLALAGSELAGNGHLGVRSATGVVTRVFLSATPVEGSQGVVLSLRVSQTELALADAVRFQAGLLSGIRQAVVVTDPAADVVFWNPAAEQLYGWSAEEAIGRPVMEVTPSVDPAQQARNIAEAVGQGRAWGGDDVLRRRDGSEFQALVSVAPVYDDRRSLVALIGVSADITARKRAEQEARELSAIVESTADAVLTHDLDGVVRTWNEGARRLFGWSAEEAVGQHLGQLFAASLEPDELRFGIALVTRGEVVRDHQQVGVRHDGSEVDIALTASPILDERGDVAAASVIARDVSERRRLQQQLHHQATHDALTGLPNRVLLQDRLEHTLATSARTETPVAVLFIDLDEFKQVNDVHGHLVGDELLVEVARRLTAVTRPADTVSRFGGDEFVVVCGDTDVTAAEQIAARIEDACRPVVHAGGQPLQLRTSIGVAVTPPLEPDGALLMRCADAALYQAKAAGRARCRVYGSEPAGGR